jgi:hypothetical protein
LGLAPIFAAEIGRLPQNFFHRGATQQHRVAGLALHLWVQRLDAIGALPEGIDPEKAGPLFCGGITVFAPIADGGVKPTHRVGVIGIGGLGHLALQFLNKWGCHVTAFTSSENKAEEASDTIIIQETPMFWIGMFKKIILNNKAFYQHLYNSLDPEVVKEMVGVSNMADVVTYSRAWFYISKLDLKRRVDVDALITFTDDNLLYASEMALRFFEDIEEYEKCAHIKKIQDTVKKILDKA